MNITSAFEIMFLARNIQLRLALIEPTCYLNSYGYKPLILSYINMIIDVPRRKNHTKMNIIIDVMKKMNEI